MQMMRDDNRSFKYILIVFTKTFRECKIAESAEYYPVAEQFYLQCRLFSIVYNYAINNHG